VLQAQKSYMKRLLLTVLLTAAVMWGLLYAPTPYVVYEPGIAISTAPMVTVEEGGDEPGGGALLLTAIKLTQPNMLGVIKAQFSSRSDVRLKRDVLGSYSPQQYAERLNVVMQGSQNDAVEAAYRAAGIAYHSVTQAIMVSDVRPQQLQAVSAFVAGDKLIGLKGGEPFGTIANLMDALKGLQGATQPAAMEVEREGTTVEVAIYASAFSPSSSAEQMLRVLGIAELTELRSLEPEESRNKITIAAGDIGGPSAGLVFTLQALDLLTAGDLTAGHRIAATGTITAEGKVGPIGGVQQKIVIASEEGAELFLVPAANYKEANAKAKRIGTAMKVVSVATLTEARQAIQSFDADAAV
jgi:PDZ domain-containing protein